MSDSCQEIVTLAPSTVAGSAQAYGGELTHYIRVERSRQRFGSSSKRRSPPTLDQLFSPSVAATRNSISSASARAIRISASRAARRSA
jgi:hypothetical protein